MNNEHEQIISNINGLYPIDSEYPDTNEVGKRLLMQAIEQWNWRELPDELLKIYEQLCIAEDNRSTNEFIKKHKGW